jgi:hypothetical protein
MKYRPVLPRKNGSASASTIAGDMGGTRCT